MAHHKLLNTPDDPDRNFHIEHDKSTPRQFITHFTRLVFGGQLWTSIVVNGFLRPKSTSANGNGNGNGGAKPVVVVNRIGHPEILNLVPVQLLIWGALWLASGQWWLYIALWLGPIFTLGTFVGFLRGFVDHARLASEEEGATSGRLITVLKANWLERAFLAPFHFNYHGEHHMFPAVPPYYLPELHKLLQSDPDYRNRYGVRPSYGQFLSEYWRQISRSSEAQGQTATDHS